MSNKKTFTLLFFAQFREQLQLDKLEWSVEESHIEPLTGNCSWSVADLRRALTAQGGRWQSCLGQGRQMVAVNQTLANEETLINFGDEVAFFPPVTGG